MPDITMCKGNDCPLKESCFRYLATPVILYNTHYPDYQSYFTDPPFNKETNTCDNYWEARSKSQIKRLDIMTK